MNEGLPDPLIPKSGQEEEDMGRGDPKTDRPVSEAVARGEGVPKTGEVETEGVSQGSLHPESQAPSADAGDRVQDMDGGAGDAETTGDWWEPLEDDEEEVNRSKSWVNGSREPDMENLFGESEKNGTERNITQKRSNDPVSVPRRRRRPPEKGENWIDWPLLGEGWKRREVFRRSGFSVGKTDTYYMSPEGERVRSRIELVKLLAGKFDLSNFEFKSGTFLSDNSVKVKKKPHKTENAASTEDGTPSERSFSSEKTGTPERSHIPQSSVVTPQKQQLTPPQASTATSPQSPNSFRSPPRLVRASPLGINTPPRQTSGTSSFQFGELSPQRQSASCTPSREGHFPQLSPAWLDSALAPLSPTSSPERDYDEALGGLGTTKPFRPPHISKHSPSPAAMSHSRSPRSASNGEGQPLAYAGAAATLVYGCSNCGSSYPGMVFRRIDQTSLCPKCKSEKKPEAPRNIVFRKWLPCGQCRACQVTEDCGTCASCRHSLFNPTSLKPVRCRRRKCLCPIRKVGHGQWVLGRASDEKGKETPKTPPKNVNKISKFGRKLKMTKIKRQIANDVMQYAYPQYSDSDDFPLYFDDNDDMESGPKKRNRRACWKCDACLRTTDCGRCDFCMDKPKFGGRNKKRQKCRLRQCQSQAMRHLLPFQTGKTKSKQRSAQHRYAYRKMNQRTKPSWVDMEFINDEDEEGYIGTLRPGVYHLEKDDDDEEDQGEDQGARDEMSQVNSVLNCDSNSRLASEELYISSYPYSLQDCFQTDSSNLKIINVTDFPTSVHDASQHSPPLDTEALYDQERYGIMPELLRKAGVLGEDVEIVEVDTGEPEEQDVTPVITQIFSLADNTSDMSNTEQELLQLLGSLRKTVLPAHWVGLMVEGPRLQLVQCSKLSTMADTVVQIEPGFFYQISVQDQPLLLTHQLYEDHPPRLANVDDVVALLLDLEKYTVCQGYPTCVPQPNQEPVLYVRAAACGLLVPQAEERCDKCEVTQLVV